ncbi:MAG: hypothetical protein E6K82_26150 [Candidatus Rokuibacteriota bacterium]|nr:MAG: hypothetical protein E6K82_26150 [Candidatus Rokubacteria bacterium]
MAAKVRCLLPIVRLSPRLYASVDRLAGLAGVTPSDVVEFVLGEILEGELASAWTPPPAPPGPSSKSPARVIPITRARRRARNAGRRRAPKAQPARARAMAAGGRASRASPRA